METAMKVLFQYTLIS